MKFAAKFVKYIYGGIAMKKKILAAVMVAALGCGTTVNAMAIPSHSIIIGNKAYSLDYVVKPANYGEINAQMANASNVYYVVNSSIIKDLFTDNYVSTNVIDSIPTITYKDGDGEQYIATGGSPYLQHIADSFTASASVDIGSSLNLFKKINITSSTIPDASYYRIDGSSYVKSIGTPIQATVSGSSVKVYFYADSNGDTLVATGNLDISSSTGSGVRIVGNVQYAMGNSSGNINNLGIAAQDGMWIYYRGTGGALYRIKQDGIDKTQLTIGQDVRYINVVGNYVYYTASTPATKTTAAYTGIYKMKTDGSDAVQTTASGRVTAQTGRLVASFPQIHDVIVAGDWIYYINDTDGRMYRVNVSGYGNTAITSDKYTDINIVKNYIYAVNVSDNNKIYKIDLSNSNAASKVSDVNAMHLNVVDDEIYYRNYGDNEKLYRMSTDGSENVKLCDDMALNVNVSGDSVYYKNASDGNKLYRINTDGTGGQKILATNTTSGTRISTDVVEYIAAFDPTIYYSPSTLATITSIQKDGTGKTVLK